MLLLRDPLTMSATTLTLWDSEADMEASATGNYPVQLAKREGLLAGTRVRNICEVTDISLWPTSSCPRSRPCVNAMRGRIMVTGRRIVDNNVAPSLDA